MNGRDEEIPGLSQKAFVLGESELEVRARESHFGESRRCAGLVSLSAELTPGHGDQTATAI
jgi:hypothetical protein